MDTLCVGEFKEKFSEILMKVRMGERFCLSYGKKKEKVAVFIPYKKYKQQKRKLGILKNQATFSLAENFKITDEELLSS